MDAKTPVHPINKLPKCNINLNINPVNKTKNGSSVVILRKNMAENDSPSKKFKSYDTSKSMMTLSPLSISLNKMVIINQIFLILF